MTTNMWDDLTTRTGTEDIEDSQGPAGLLDELHGALTRYVVLPSRQAAYAVTLWTAATHAQTAFEHATRLAIISPEKRCGKSRLLDVIEATCRNPLITVNISSAALVRSIGADPPTLLLDEADTVFGAKTTDTNEDLRGILNAGHQRNRPYVRWDPTTRTREVCPTFAMAALAGIGNLPDTIMDRAVPIQMRRRAPGERVRPYRQRRDGPLLAALGERLTDWADEHLAELAEAEPVMPVEDRAADTWEPLIAVADAAGGRWPDRARHACQVLTAAADEDTTIGERLLADLHTIFGDADALHGATILDRLHSLDEAPWADWYGRPFTARDLAKMLKPYGVTSVDVKRDGASRKGYRREHLTDAWNRYLPAAQTTPQTAAQPGLQAPSATSATSATMQVNDGDQVAGRGSQTRPATPDNPVTSQVAEVAEVADTPHPDGTHTEICRVCHQPMTVLEPGQTTHPACAP